MAGPIIFGTDASDVVVIGWIAELRFDFVRASFAVPLIGLLLLSLSTTKTKAPAGSKHKPLRPLLLWGGSRRTGHRRGGNHSDPHNLAFQFLLIGRADLHLLAIKLIVDTAAHNEIDRID